MFVIVINNIHTSNYNGNDYDYDYDYDEDEDEDCNYEVYDYK